MTNKQYRIIICTECAGKGKLKGKHYKKGKKCVYCDGQGELAVELTMKGNK